MEIAMVVKVSTEGRITLPKAVREAAGTRPGDHVIVRARAEGGVIIESDHNPRIPRAAAEMVRSRRLFH
jgi:AbrB family looped-hinge helix DNA binding protein